MGVKVILQSHVPYESETADTALKLDTLIDLSYRKDIESIEETKFRSWLSTYSLIVEGLKKLGACMAEAAAILGRWESTL
jgi:hypothetical protein